MPARAVIGIALVTLALSPLAACSGGGESAQPASPPPASPPPEPSAQLLDVVSFAQVTAGEIEKQSDLQAEATSGPFVRVDDGLNWLEADLTDAFGQYRQEPQRRGEIVGAAATDVLRRIERRLDGESFAAVRAGLRPLLKPRFALRRQPVDPVVRPFAADLLVTYGVQREHSFMLVTRSDLSRWHRTVGQIDPIAKRNLVRHTEELRCEEQLCGWANGDGYDATRMIVPKLRRDIVREIGKAAYAVPLEHVFVAVPIKYAQRIRPKVVEQFTTGDNPISPEVFVERGGRLVPLPS